MDTIIEANSLTGKKEKGDYDIKRNERESTGTD